MVIEKPAKGSMYSGTNKALLSILNKGISQEKKEIGRLTKQELVLKKEVQKEEKQIKLHHLKSKKNQLNKRLQDLRAKKRASSKELAEKKSALNHSETTVQFKSSKKYG
jgi:hypothetical protein